MSSPYQAHTRAFQFCPWCHGRGCTFCPGEYEKYAVERAKPIFTARTDNPEEMADLKRIFGADNIVKELGPGGGGMPEIEFQCAVANLLRLLHKDDSASSGDPVDETESSLPASDE